MMRRALLAVWVLILATVVVPALAEGPAIKSIEINQAIGVQKNNNLKFVAGKQTVVGRC